MSDVDLRRQVADHAFWWHSIELTEGIVTPGHQPSHALQEELEALRLPDLRGKTVLDVGAWDGYFSFAAERLGASRVVALDYHAWATNPIANSGAPLHADRGTLWDPINLPGKVGFELARKALGSRVESVFADLLALDTSTLGEFDVVLFLGVLYHTRHPLQMLDQLALLTREKMILETESFTLPDHPDLKLAQFFETDELEGDASNWWSPNEPAIAGMCRSSGFAEVEFLPTYQSYPPEAGGLVRHRAIAHVRKEGATGTPTPDAAVEL